MIRVKGQFCSFTLIVNAVTEWLSIYDEDGEVLLSQKDAQELLPYLQSYAETGTLELQEGHDADFQEACIAMAGNIADQGKRIEALLDLVQSLEQRIVDITQLARDWEDLVSEIEIEMDLSRSVQVDIKVLKERNYQSLVDQNHE